MFSDVAKVEIRSGDIRRLQASRSTILPDNIIIHNDYKKPFYLFDIALLKTEKFEFSSKKLKKTFLIIFN